MLPTCPACKQSVLDDDAEECPFCGANMKTGKPSKGKTPSAAPAKPAAKSVTTPPPSSTSSTKPGSAKPSAGKPSSARKASSFDDDDDDPFSAPEDDPFTAAAKEEAANKAKAVVVSPKASKLNTVEIKCPMCETVGYIPESAGGKDVKCYNPKCSMPNFLAPKRFAPPIQTIAPPKAVKKTSNSKLPLILSLVGGVALVAIVAAVAFLWDTAPPEPKTIDFGALAKSNPGGTQPGVEPGGDPSGTNDTGETNPGGENSVIPQAADVPQGPDVPALLTFMSLLSSEDRIQQNKLKCRRLVAVGHAVRNDQAGMETQFQIMDGLDASQGTFKVPALLAMAWNRFEAGDKAGALVFAEKALAQEGNSSRETQEPVMELASLLVALDKLKEAQQLVVNKLPADQNTPLAILLTLARQRRDFDLTVGLPGVTNPLDRPSAQLGVTLILAARGLWKESQTWIDAISNEDVKTECQIAWADARTRTALRSKSAVDPSVEALAANLTPSVKIMLLGRLALTHAIAQNQAEADRLIKEGQAALKAVPVPAAVRVEDFKQALDWKTPPLRPLRQAMIGAALIGQAQGHLKQVDAGWLTTLEALKIARAMAPSPDAAALLTRTADEMGSTNLRAKIRMLLNLRTDAEAVKRTSDLNENLRNLTDEANARYQLQEVALIGATHAGMAALVWKEVASLAQRRDASTREPFAYGRLAHHLQHQLQLDNKQEELTELKARLEGVELPHDDVYSTQLLADASLTKEAFKDLIAYANQNKPTPGTEAIFLQTFIKAAKLPELGPQTLKQIDELDLKANPALNTVKLEGLRMTAAYLSRTGKSKQAHQVAEAQHSTPLEKITAFLGVVEGDAAWHREHPAPVAPVATVEPAK